MNDQIKQRDPIYIPIIPYDEFRTAISSSENSTILDPEGLSVVENIILTVQELLEVDAPLTSLPLYAKLTLSIIMAMSLLIGSYFKCIIYMFVFMTSRKNRGWIHRPINVLTVTSAFTHHVTHVLAGVWYILVLIMDTPLIEIFGCFACNVMMAVAVYGLAYLSIGSLGIAIYRVLYIKQEYLVKYVIGERVILLILLTLSIFLTGLVVVLFMTGHNGDMPGVNMCTGLPVSQTLIMIQYRMSNGDETLSSKYGAGWAIYLLLAAQTVEFGIYIWFFYFRYQHDNGNIAKYLRQNDIRDRNQKNVVTFLGQFYSFVIEYSFLISMLILHYLTGEQSQHFRALVGITKFCDFGLLSAVEVLTSPGLKSFMK